MAILFTTSIPCTTCPQLVYCPSRKAESFLVIKNWLSLLMAASLPLATPNAPALNVILLYSEGILPPPVPFPAGSPPCITQSSTRWNVSPLKKPASALVWKLAIVLLTLAEASVYSLATMVPLGVSITMYLSVEIATWAPFQGCASSRNTSAATIMKPSHITTYRCALNGGSALSNDARKPVWGGCWARPFPPYTCWRATGGLVPLLTGGVPGR